MRRKVLLTVTTYPLPSKSYDELVCTAGLLESGEWIRIYPVPLGLLMDLKTRKFKANLKYTWVELDLERRTKDFRPESHSPKHKDFSDLKVLDHLDTTNDWEARKVLCLKKVYTSMEQLLADSKPPMSVSLAAYQPKRIIEFVIESSDEDWDPMYKELRKQTDLFAPEDRVEPKELIRKIPWKFSYRFEDDTGKVRKLMIEDWEIGALYWKCMATSGGNEKEALRLVRLKYEKEFLSKCDITLFLGTTLEFHAKSAPNPFLIIGVFYPRRRDQMKLEF
ncbi:MAG: hypothetical protein WAU70_08725 [Flavobacteriales bacterium]